MQDKEIQIIPVDKEPSLLIHKRKLTEKETERINQEKEKLKRSYLAYDGDVLLLKYINSTKVLHLYQGKYSWIKSGLFVPLSTSIILFDKKENALWQKRGSWVYKPYHWHYSASGTVEKSIQSTIKNELREELCLDPSSVSLMPLCMTLNENYLDFVYAGHTKETPKEDGSEVIKLKWSKTPPEPYAFEHMQAFPQIKKLYLQKKK